MVFVTENVLEQFIIVVVSYVIVSVSDLYRNWLVYGVEQNWRFSSCHLLWCSPVSALEAYVNLDIVTAL